MKVSVIVPVYNDRQGLKRCLKALANQTLPSDSFEVLVIDNGGDEPLTEVVAGFPFARLLHETTPGAYAARNRGCASASGEILAFTDADCLPRATWLEAAVSEFSASPHVAAIGGRIELVGSETRSAAECYETVFAFRQRLYVEEEGFAATANMLVRKDVFDNVGPFNAGLTSGGDHEWGARLVAAGHRWAYLPDAVVAHRPRTALIDLINRRRRIVSGPATRRRASGTTPRGLGMAAAMLGNPSQFGLTFVQSAKAVLVGVLLALVGYVEKIRLALGGSPRRT